MTWQFVVFAVVLLAVIIAIVQGRAKKRRRDFYAPNAFKEEHWNEADRSYDEPFIAPPFEQEPEPEVPKVLAVILPKKLHPKVAKLLPKKRGKKK